MEHVRALAVKFLLNGVIILAVLSLLGDVDAATAIYIALIITIVAYILGDLLILPAFGNTTASISDGIMAFLITWIIPFVVPGLTITLGTALAVGAAIGVGEWFFHKYFKRTVTEENKQE